MIKPTMWSEGNDDNKRRIRDTLHIVLSESYKMMHPFMPFLSEELFQRIKKARYGKGYNFGNESIVISSYPDKPIKEWENIEIEDDMKLAVDLIQSIRTKKQSSFGLSTKTKYNDYIFKIRKRFKYKIN